MAENTQPKRVENWQQGICRVCQQAQELDADGLIGHHDAPGKCAQLCPGTQTTPVETQSAGEYSETCRILPAKEGA